MRKPIKAIEFNPVNDPKHMHGYKNVRWVENVSKGLRLVGFADEIAGRRIDHKGWYTTDDNDFGEVYRGVVYQLPSHGDEGECYVYGYADPCNADCALLSFDITGNKEEAARYADRFAEIFAEEARDYNRAWQAGRRCSDIAEEIQSARKEALAIAAEMRAAKKASVQAPTICATLRVKVFSLYREIQEARKTRAELVRDFGTCPGFVE